MSDRGCDVWQEVSVVVLALYYHLVIVCLGVGWIFVGDPPETGLARAMGMWAVATIFKMGLGLGCIYWSVRSLRRGDIRSTRIGELATRDRVRAIAALAMLTCGWVSVLAAVGLDPESIVELVTHPWSLQRPLSWAMLVVPLFWTLFGILGRPRAACLAEPA